ncbi:hypothetical protein ABL78_4168 [Leptomonas seymouri]|uniref:Uncharacterized protein n=1 Tax=Leptomonas seymouri TaxID=5684 RepID=A0A0N1PC55_LEPSE|nr:hypothetical protein ABL78_4168 [Leptomonas seymouri]|eukprot:KPI86751.1 hypothetical protein ABL78_4168 [Leptomonas seymouri]
MKHFQSKHKAEMNPENAYATLATYLTPRDRLLRQSVTGRGAGRILVLDHQQKVKGVYIPVSCLPHPAAVTGGDSSLGVTVEDYLKVIEPLAQLSDRKALKTATEENNSTPTVLAVIAHPQGMAYGTFFADGSTALPFVNTQLSSRHLTTASKKNMDESSGLIQSLQSYRSPDSIAEIIDEFQCMLGKNREAISRCSTFYWITRDESESLSLKALRAHELRSKENLVRDDGATASPVPTQPIDQAISFCDRRWLMLHDTFFEQSRARMLYARDPVTQQRIVDPKVLQKAMRYGMLLLDYVPKSVLRPSSSVESMPGADKTP